jgi:ABC-2 type transport system ATP-binding protein
MPMIVAEGLTKYYGRSLAVDHLSFGVEEGEIFGFLGPNGAGKTTTIKMLNTLTSISEGRATIDGFDLARSKSEVRKRIGLVPQDLTLDREMRGRENLRIQAKLYDVPEAEARKKMAELLQLVGLQDVADREVGTYSWGMQKRLELIMGLVHTPKVLFLDEPTLGLDAQSRFAIWEYIRKLNLEFRITVFLTTHYLEEADELSDRIAIIDGGKLKTVGPPEQLKAELGGEVIELRLEAAPAGLSLEGMLASLPGVISVSAQELYVRVETVKAESVIPRLIAALAAKGVNVAGVELSKANLNQVFQKFTTSDPSSSEDADQARMITRERAISQRS